MARCTARKTGRRSTEHADNDELREETELRLDVELLLTMEHGGEGEGEGGGEITSDKGALGIGPNSAC